MWLPFFALRESIDASDLLQIQYLALGAVFFVAFFFFAFAVRLFNHLGYLINANDSNLEIPESVLSKKKDVSIEKTKISKKQEVELDSINPDETNIEITKWNLTLREQNVEKAQALLKKATIYFYLGTRTIFLAILTGTWIVNEWVMLFASLTLLPIMFLNDHV